MTLSSVSDVDASSPKHLADRYAIAGVGETAFSRGGLFRTTRAMATEAISKALADANMTADDVDGMLSYSSGDSTFSPFIAGDQFTLADCAAAVHLPLVSSCSKIIYGQDLLAALPVKDYLKHVGERPTVQKVNADRKTNTELMMARMKK